MEPAVTLTDRDKEMMDKYEDWEEPTTADELADYLNALAKWVAVVSRPDSYDVNELLRMNGVATDLRNGDRTVEDAKAWVESDFEPAV